MSLTLVYVCVVVGTEDTKINGFMATNLAQDSLKDHVSNK